MTHIFKRANRSCRSEDILFVIAVYVVHLDRNQVTISLALLKAKKKTK